MSKKKWEKPIIMSMGELPVALANCIGGSTHTNDPQACVNGQVTGGIHRCSTGSSAGTCSNGGSR